MMLTSLPEEILFEIFVQAYKQQGTTGMKAFGATSKQLQRIFNDKSLWQKVYYLTHKVHISNKSPKHNFQQIRKLLKKYPNLHEIDDQQNNALHYAATLSWESPGLIATLCEHKLSVLSQNQFGHTPLHTAVDTGNDIAVKALLSAQSSTTDICNVKDNLGRTALHIAAGKGYLSICKLLVNSGANLVTKDTLGQTALHHAAKFGKQSTTQFLASNYKLREINIADTQGNTALLLAASTNREAIVRELIEVFNADIFTKDTVGNSLIQLLALPNRNRNSLLEKYINDKMCWTPVISYHGYRTGGNLSSRSAPAWVNSPYALLHYC